jgi:glycine hydroxymethyltransferase
MQRNLASILKDNEQWRGSCLNLIASENVTSPAVRAALSSDLGHRYTLPFNKRMDGMLVRNAYMGTKFTDEAQARTQELACEVFGVKYAYVNALSGHIAAMTALMALCKKGDLIMAPDDSSGGYHGWTGPYLPEALGMKFSPLPFNSHDWDLDYRSAADDIERQSPAMVVVGMSYFPFPLNIGPIRQACDKVGAYLCYDASHVLGLIAGGQFQKPLKEGADLMLGSTHKSFFGPQGGLMLTNDENIYKRILENATWRSIDNAHWNRVAALGVALEEMKEHGKAYASQIVKNSKALAKALALLGVPLRFAHRGYTESHQVLMDNKRAATLYGAQFPDLAARLEANDIIIDSVGRMGTSEVTRLGLKEKDMATIASLIVDVMKHDRKVNSKVKALRKKAKLSYC